MREIKFRCWHDGRMIYQDELVSDQKGLPPFYATADFMFRHISDNRLMQFTGLPDKNEKEIYESDVVKCGYGVGIVVYMLGAWMVRWVDDPEANMEFLGLNNRCRRAREDSEMFEVIGNIWENPELITPSTESK